MPYYDIEPRHDTQRVTKCRILRQDVDMTSARNLETESGVIPAWDLADRMAKSLRVAGMGNQEMAAALAVNRDTVSRWINGRNQPSRATLLVWASVTGVDLGWLESGTAAPEDGRSSVRHQGLEPRTRWFEAFRADQQEPAPVIDLDAFRARDAA